LNSQAVQSEPQNNGFEGQQTGSFEKRRAVSQPTTGHKTAISFVCRTRLLAFFFFFDRNHFAALVMSAARANRMHAAHLATIGASNQANRRQGVVRAAAITAAARMFTFRMRGHDYLLNRVYTGLHFNEPFNKANAFF
jgi:hypothetical protein